MTKDEIMVLLNRKIEDAIETAEQDHGKHNAEAWNSYYNGVAQGLRDAKSVIGMLDKQNKISK